MASTAGTTLFITINSLVLLLLFVTVANGSVYREAPTDDSSTPTYYTPSDETTPSEGYYSTPSEETPSDGNTYYTPYTPSNDKKSPKPKKHSKKSPKAHWKHTPTDEWNYDNAPTDNESTTPSEYYTPVDDTPTEDQNPWEDENTTPQSYYTPTESTPTPSPPPPPPSPTYNPTPDTTPETQNPAPDTSMDSPTTPETQNPPPPPNQDTTPTNNNNNEAIWLEPHNAARARVGLSPLVWKSYLANYAQNWVNTQRQNCDMVHSNGPYGENIFWGSGSSYTGADAIKNWVDERDHYDYQSNTCFQGDCGHYTQIVWRGTTGLGCARLVCDNDRGTFISCNYDPPGNAVGQKPY